MTKIFENYNLRNPSTQTIFRKSNIGRKLFTGIAHTVRNYTLYIIQYSTSDHHLSYSMLIITRSIDGQMVFFF